MWTKKEEKINNNYGENRNAKSKTDPIAVFVAIGDTIKARV